MKRVTLSVSVVFVFTFVLSAMMYDAYAIPTFSRKFDMPCSDCHVAFPKLTGFGTKFREKGYRMLGDEGTYIFKEAVPISAAVNVAWESESEEVGGTKNSRNSIDFEEARLFAGGTLAPRISYFVDLKLFEKKPSDAVELQEEAIAAPDCDGGDIIEFRDLVVRQDLAVFAIALREL